MASIIVGLGILFFLGHALSWFFSKTKIPDLLILVAIGYIMGPILGLITINDFGKVGAVISTLALVVILYEGGLHLSAKDLLSGSLPAAALSFVGFLMAVIIGTVTVFGLALQPFTVALLIGVGIGSTSSAIVIPMVKFLSVDEKTKTILSLESAFTDVLTIVTFLVLTDAFAAGQFNFKAMMVGLGPNTIMALIVGISSAILWSFFNKKFKHLIPGAFAGEAWALLTYGILELTGLNGAIGVLALGFTLANLNLLPGWLQPKVSLNPVSLKDLSLLKEITHLLRTIFFLYLGIIIKLSSWKIILLAVLICVLIFLSRYLMVQLIFKNNLPRLDAMVTTAMGPRGLACAVLATIPLQRGLEGGDFIQQLLFAVIPFSIFLTAVFVAFSENLKFRTQFSKLFKNYKELGENSNDLT